MRRPVRVLLIIAAAVIGFFVAWMHHSPSPSPAVTPMSGVRVVGAPRTAGEVDIPHPVAENNEIDLRPQRESITPGGDPIAKTVQKLLDEPDDPVNPRAIPRNTRLLSLNVKSGLAVVDLSREFNALNDHGSTAEEIAQNSLRETLAQFPQIKKMRVTVEGKQFEGGHSGAWDDVPVRDDA